MSRVQKSSSPDSSLKLRRRPDLEVYPQRRRGRRVWVIKDPVSLQYFQFRAEEFAILQWLDGRSDLPDIRDRFERQFAPRRLTNARLHSYIANLHRSGLILSDAPGQGDQLRHRYGKRQRSSLLNRFSNPLAIRFRGVDPDRFLSWLSPKTSWLFSPWSAAVSLLLVFSATTLIVTEFDSILKRLPELKAYLTPSHLLLLGVALALVKLIHELAHALCCKHYGARCHELGVMLLVFTPCLYCNVTDSWKLSSRWQRVAISAAGIIVEVVIASLCTLLWFYSQPGSFNTLCLNVMIVCSIGTLFLNGNPLLRYDGYYILSDALDLPNLWQDSRRTVRRIAMRMFLGIDPGQPVSAQGRPTILLSYAVASMTYRMVVMASIVYLAYQLLKPIGLLLIAQLLAIALLIGILAPPVAFLTQIMTNPSLRRRVRPRRFLIAAATTGSLLAIGLLLPLPCRIAAPTIIEPLDARRVYVSVPGRLIRSVSAGTHVSRGEPLAALENLEVRFELERVRGQLRRQELRVKNLESLRGESAAAAEQIPAANEMLADLQRRLAQLLKDEEALLLTAPVDGTVLSPPSLPDSPSDEVELGHWSGSPMDECNLGVTLQRKTLFCLVGKQDEFEAAVYIDQSDVQYVQAEQDVKILLDVSGGKTISGTVTEISRVNLKRVPTQLAVDQQIASRVDSLGVPRPETTSYKAHVRIEPGDVPLLIGARGRAIISVQWQPLSQRVMRFVSRTFKPVI